MTLAGQRQGHFALGHDLRLHGIDRAGVGLGGRVAAQQLIETGNG